MGPQIVANFNAEAASTSESKQAQPRNNHVTVTRKHDLTSGTYADNDIYHHGAGKWVQHVSGMNDESTEGEIVHTTEQREVRPRGPRVSESYIKTKGGGGESVENPS